MLHPNCTIRHKKLMHFLPIFFYVFEDSLKTFLQFCFIRHLLSTDRKLLTCLSCKISTMYNDLKSKRISGTSETTKKCSRQIKKSNVLIF